MQCSLFELIQPYIRWQVAWILGLMLLTAATEGLGLMLLVPLLETLGSDEGKRASSGLWALIPRVYLPASTVGLLAVFVGVVT